MDTDTTHDLFDAPLWQCPFCVTGMVTAADGDEMFERIDEHLTQEHLINLQEFAEGKQPRTDLMEDSDA